MATSTEPTQPQEPKSAPSSAQPPDVTTATAIAAASAASPNQALTSVSGALARANPQKNMQLQLTEIGITVTLEERETGSSLRDYPIHADEPMADDFDKSVELKNRLFVLDDNGHLLWAHNESSYTANEISRRGEFSMADIYENSTPSELRKYVRDRGLNDPYPKGVTMKYYYLRVLDRADESLSFPFLKLPPELRTMVYIELLTLRGCTCFTCPSLGCHTAIMQANKQIYAESKGILYSENVIECKLAVYTDEEEIISCYTSIHDEFEEDEGVELSQFYHGMTALPEWFHRIQSLRLIIDAHGMGAEGAARGFLQGCILSLASFFLDGHCLNKLQVHFINHLHQHGTNIVDAVLYPLRRVSGLTQVSFTGDVKENLSMSIAAEMQRPRDSVFNTVPHLYHLRREAKSYIAMLEALDPWKEDNYKHPMELEDNQTLVDRIENLLEETDYLVKYGEEDTGEFRDAKAERNLIRKMRDLRKCLDAPRMSEFRDAHEDFLVARADRKRYQSKTDFRKGGAEYRDGYVEPRWKGRVIYDEL